MSCPSGRRHARQDAPTAATPSVAVTRSTSSNVVSPRRALATPQVRSVIIPAARAAAATAASVGVRSRTWRSALVTGSTSKIPTSPR